MSSISTIQTIPSEVICAIADHLTINECKRLASTCKQFSKFFQENVSLLYQRAKELLLNVGQLKTIEELNAIFFKNGPRASQDPILFQQSVNQKVEKERYQQITNLWKSSKRVIQGLKNISQYIKNGLPKEWMNNIVGQNHYPLLCEVLKDNPSITSVELTSSQVEQPNSAIWSPGHGLLQAAINGSYESMQIIIESKYFAKIHQSELGSALTIAVMEINDKAEGAHLILKSSRVNEIEVSFIKDAFINAAKKGNFNCLQAIINSSRFNDISLPYIHQALLDLINQKKVSDGHKKCFQAIVTSSRSEEIDPQLIEEGSMLLSGS